MKISKFLALVLRHKPEEIGIALDGAGYVAVSELLEALARHGSPVTEAELQYVVATNSKKRFAFSEDGLRIRASQGHSIVVELGYEPSAPPERLYHGTVERCLPSIRTQGLIKGSRQHVHLSLDVGTARKVGERRGKPVVLAILAGEMHRAGLAFYISDNGVWLTDHVPVKYIELESNEAGA